MRFLITVAPGTEGGKPDPDQPFDEKLFATYMRFNEDLMKAGVLVAAEGLNPGGQGARIGVAGGRRRVLDGPFAESKELVGGFYLIDVPSLDEAVAWALRCPVGLGSDEVLTVHPLTGAADIPPRLLQLAKEAAPTWTASLWKA